MGKIYYTEIKKHLVSLSLVEEEISDISEIKGLSELTDLQVLRLQYNSISEIKNLDKLTNLQVLELQNNNIKEIKGLENLINLIHLNLWENPVYEMAKKKFGGSSFFTGEFKKPELLVQYCQDANPSFQLPTKKIAKDYVQTKIIEKKMLEKFKSILEMAHEVKRDEVARSLGISKEILFENLLKWKKNLPFILKGDLIIVPDMTDFIGKIDQQFDAWNTNGKVISTGANSNGPMAQNDQHAQSGQIGETALSPEKMQGYKKILEDEQKIRMVFVIHKESGGMLINQFYGLEDLDDKSDLITGFLTTVSQWGKEVNRSSADDALSLLSWRNFHIHLEHGDHIMLAIVCDEPLNSTEMNERIQNLISQIEITYQKELQRFTGNIKPFEQVVSLIDSTLKAIHQFPCKIDLDKLKEVQISTGIKQYFTTQSYKKNTFFILDAIRDVIKGNTIPNELEVYKEIYTLLDNQIISPNIEAI